MLLEKKKELGEHSSSERFGSEVYFPSQMVREMRAVAKMDVPIVLLGETGTGKEVVAQYIHKVKNKIGLSLPFVAVNCANLQGDLVNSTLFGHVKGSFTGASQAKPGAVEEANGGILFLDEIHCLSIKSQQQLLRVLNNGSYTRIGENIERKSKFQIITATSKRLQELVQDGILEVDFLMRIYGYSFNLLPLRKRKDEISSFVDLFLSQMDFQYEEKELAEIKRLCRDYHWPGNIRQLKVVLRLLFVQKQVKNREICKELFDAVSNIFEPIETEAATSGALQGTENEANQPGRVIKIIDTGINGEISNSPKSIKERITDTVDLFDFSNFSLDEFLGAIENMLIEDTLGSFKRIDKAAKNLCLTRAQLDFRRKKYQL